jgi:hypothetical protein
VKWKFVFCVASEQSLFKLHNCDLSNYAVSTWTRIALNGRMVGEQERSARKWLQLNQGHVSRLPGRAEENYEKSVTMSSFQANIWIWKFLNMKQEGQYFENDILFQKKIVFVFCDRFGLFNVWRTALWSLWPWVAPMRSCYLRWQWLIAGSEK